MEEEMYKKNIRFVRDYRHNYLVMGVHEISSNEMYVIKMITENKIDGLLPCQQRNINGEILLYYEITSKQTMKNLFEIQLFKMEHLQYLFRNIKKLNCELEKYLLNVGSVFFVPEFIFCSMNVEECCFLLYPQESEALEVEFQRFMDFLFERMDKEDIRLVEAVYQMADLIHKQQFVLDEILIWFEENYGEHNEEPESRPMREGVIEQPEEIPNYEAKPEYEPPRKSIFAWIKERLFGQKEKKEPFCEKQISYCDTYETEPVKKIEESDYTMYIPWVENSDNKLYGIGKGNKYHIALSRLPLTVGKMPGAVDMVIQDQSISRLHAKFTREGNRFYITDLNSTNGTFLNGMRMQPNACEQIEPGDEIGLGKLKFIYR